VDGSRERDGFDGRDSPEIGEHDRFELRTYRWRRVAWFALAGILGAGLAGALGAGPRGAILRAALLYLFLLLVFRLAGTRILGRITTFDFVLLLVISETTGQALVADGHLGTALLAILTLVGLDIALALAKQRWAVIDRWLEGTPLVLVENGRPIRERMQRQQIDESEILCSAREHHGLERLDQIRFAILERSGAISIIPERGDSPAGEP
jgi:uncharacterized membrane protein YcaP (DUF421 family)